MPRIGVGIRSKPGNKDELRLTGFSGIQAMSDAKLEIIASDSKHEFLFNHYFDETSEQQKIFTTVMMPMINDAIEGFNCTVFAFGQTVFTSQI